MLSTKRLTLENTESMKKKLAAWRARPQCIMYCWKRAPKRDSFCESAGRSAVSDSLCPGLLEWAAGSCLQGISPARGANPGLLHCRQILYQLSTRKALKALWRVLKCLQVPRPQGHRTGSIFQGSAYPYFEAMDIWLVVLWTCLKFQLNKSLRIL